MTMCPECGEINWMIQGEECDAHKKYRRLVCLCCGHKWSEERRHEELW